MTNSFDTEKLQDFLSTEDRQITPFFFGRKNIQFSIEVKCKNIGLEYSKDSSSKPAAGETQVIMGAPGIGKTSLLSKIRQNCIAELNDESCNHKIIPVIIDTPSILTFDHLYASIHKAVSELDNKISISSVMDSANAAVKAITSVSAFGFGVGFQGSEKGKPALPKNHTILIMIDEIQSIPIDDRSEVTKVLQQLHTGSNGYPIMPVFAGLSNSISVLEQNNISRFGTNAERTLAPLGKSEVIDAVEKFMDYFHVTTNPILTLSWAKRTHEWSEGWPKHVENTMRSLGEGLLEHAGDLSKVPYHAVKLRAAKRRIDYYNTRFGPFLSTPEVIGEIMAEMGPFPRGGTEIRRIILATRKKPHWSELLSEANLPRLDFEFLLRYGYIDRLPDHHDLEYQCPIPSLQSFSVSRTGTSLHKSSFSGNLNLLEKDLDKGLDINGVDDWGRTALHLSVENEWHDMTKLLLERGADPQISDKRGKRPLDLAFEGSPTHNLLHQVTDLEVSHSIPEDYDNSDDFSPSPGF